MSKLLNAGQSPFGFHRLHSFMQCPTKYYHSYLSDEPRPRTVSPSLIMGSLVHTGLAHRYAILKAEQEGLEHDLFEPIEAMKQQAFNEENDTWLEWLPKSITAYEYYVNSDTTKEFEKGMKVVAVEEVYYLKIEKHTLTFRADLVIEKEGKIFFVDHKTCAYLASTTTDGYQASGQFLSYISYGRKMWDNFGGMLLNYIATGGTRSKKMGTKIANVTESEDHLDNFARSAYFYFEMISLLNGKELKSYPRVQSEFSCVHKYGKCPYYDRCFGNEQNTEQNTETQKGENQ